MRSNGAQKNQDRPAHKTLSGLRANVRLEEEVGTRLGSSELLLRSLQRNEAEDLTSGHSLLSGRYGSNVRRSRREQSVAFVL